jgi:phage shock protein A
MGRRLATWLLAGGAFLLAPAGLAGAQGVTQAQYASPETEAPEDRIASLEGRVAGQDAALEARVEEITAVGAELRETQSRLDGAEDRAGELRSQARELERDLAERKVAYREWRARYEEQARAAYQGRNLEGLGALIDGWVGSGRGVPGGMNDGLIHVLAQGRADLQAYEDSRVALGELLRQISRKKTDYRDEVREKETQAAALRRQEEALDEAISDLRSDRERTAGRLQELRVDERARILESRAATGGGWTGRSYQLRIARDDIVARSVGPLPEKKYMKLYKKAAERYGFGRDWHVLAAVGQVESNHGENMGPSSAGAMGPMQFLPSTWETSGVDGNGDGTANIMDPRDAIPAAAGYLKEGGAPKDWYAALFTYNHADWYVKKVLAVAESYRRLDKDHKAEPYL